VSPWAEGFLVGCLVALPVGASIGVFFWALLMVDRKIIRERAAKERGE